MKPTSPAFHCGNVFSIIKLLFLTAAAFSASLPIQSETNLLVTRT
jgi:hypothetical protein